MNKKLTTLITAVALVLSFTLITSEAKAAAPAPSIAILDTALDTSLPIFKDKIAYEVCILEWTTCPNGQSFMEGPGSVSLPISMYSKNGFGHGTQMTSVAVATNPNIKVVFVRIIGQNINGDRQITTEETIVKALSWVLQNKDKFNIQAVAMSQGHHDLMPFNSYCPITPKTTDLIKSLLASNIPSFFAAGNNRDYSRIDWPSCLPESIAVGAGTKYGIELYGNGDPKLLDFYANGAAKIVSPGGLLTNGSGTSIATQVAAAQWISIKSAKPSLGAQGIYDLVLKTSTSIKSSSISNGRLINLTGALNG